MQCGSRRAGPGLGQWQGRCRPSRTSTCCQSTWSVGLLPWRAAAQLGRTPGSAHEKYITEKYRIWMKGGEAECVTAPLSLSPPAGSRGQWEGLLRWHLRKFLLRDGTGADFGTRQSRSPGPRGASRSRLGALGTFSPRGIWVCSQAWFVGLEKYFWGGNSFAGLVWG